MHALPHSFSRSVIGKARLMVCLMRLNKRHNMVVDTTMRNLIDSLEVFFQGNDEWPANEAGERADINPLDVVAGTVKGARLRRNGVVVSRAAANDLLNDGILAVRAAEDARLSNALTISDLQSEIKRLGLNPVEVCRDHGWRG